MESVSTILINKNSKLWPKSADLKKLKSIFTANFYKIEKLDLKCTEFGFKEDSTSLQLINFLKKKSKNKLKDKKSNKSKSTKTKITTQKKKNKNKLKLKPKNNDFNRYFVVIEFKA